MPRKRKTQTGMTAQPIQAVPGTGYGQGIKQEMLARQMPAPNVRAGAVPPQSAPMRPQASPVAAPAPQPVAQVAPPQRPDLMAIAQQLRGQGGLLDQPTQRPNEPVTAGLNIGPGPGREALSQPYGSPLADMMQQLARATGDPYFADLAMRSRV